MRLRIEPLPAKLGSDVKLTCSWLHNHFDKSVRWYTYAGNNFNPITIWEFKEREQEPLFNEAQNGYSLKIRAVAQDDYFGEHAIVIQKVTEFDAKKYWCSVLISTSDYNSTKLDLEVIGKDICLNMCGFINDYAFVL